MEEKASILLLGEGNFSFTLSLWEKLQTLQHVRVVTTSFDSLDELHCKYPDSVRNVLKKLNSHGLVQVLHGIDATLCLKQQLVHVNISSFDHVIFNFPHLGTEDCMLHMSMIGHIMHSVKSVLKDQSSIFYLSLSQQQYERWNVEKMALLNNFLLQQQVPLRLSNWPQYEMKRHHTGKSFKNRIDDCSTWSFTCAAVSDTGTNCSSINLFTLSNPTLLPTAESKITNINDNKKKRKMYLLTEGKYAVETIGDKSTYKCNICDKVFLLEQGIRSHIHSNHANTSNNTVSETVKHLCVECDRTFIDEDAYKQHRLAKHDGKYEPVKPDWAAVNKLSTGEGITDSPKLFACSICGASFESQELLGIHLKGFRPFSVDQLGEELECDHCSKKFYSKRALYQHANVCADKIITEHKKDCTDGN